MAPNKKENQVAVQAFNILRSLYQLSMDLHASESRQDLIFRILNSTIDLFPYQRAMLWSLSGKKPILLGVSGREEVNKQSALAKLWKPIVSTLRDVKGVHVLKHVPKGLEDKWQVIVDQTSGLSAMWIPITSNGKLGAGLLLERWGEEEWEASESEIMTAYAKNLRLAWQQFEPGVRWYQVNSLRPRKLSAVIAVALIFLAGYVPVVSLRVVAPCEVAAKNPEIVTAPLDGVIKEIRVKPGDFVNIGDLLFTYEDRVVMQELKVAQKQVEIIKSQYDRMQFKSFMEKDAMEEMQSLKFRLEQEQIRLKLAESNAAHLEIVAKSSGICMVDHPEYWHGRPVQIGERVAMVFQPDKSKVKIFLPEDDNIEFNRDKPVAVILNASPAKSYRADLHFVAPQTSKGPKGNAFFLAEADWQSHGTILKVGSKGTAIIYGEKVSLIYWLLRKPVANVRQYIGV